jgi:hypothetical protein
MAIALEINGGWTHGTVVSGEVTGTPAGELFDAPHTGERFRIMAIDMQTAWRIG